ncbi:glycosyltransferase [Limosilactobacillus sp.]|uniref:glycosyltransferase n=1 Tax=Limosilactobacillus sp. TaxID=2773925 RepID=UPI003F010925
MRIVVSDYAATPTSGGTFSILEDFYKDVLKHDSKNEWFFILAGEYFPTSANVKIITRPDLKQSKFKKLFFELGGGRSFINHYHPDVFISLQNICTVGVKSPLKIVYLHQSIPFFQGHRFSFLKPAERRVALYQRLVGRVIKYSLSKEQPLTIVQTDWMKRAVIQQTRLVGERVLKVGPKVPVINDHHYFANQHHRFFYPATAYLYKNHQLILKAIRLLNGQGINNFQVSLTLTKEQLPTANNNVELLGFIPRQQVLKMYEDHVLIFPSYIESYGLPMLEAAQKADLILAADIDVTHEVLAGYSNVYYFDYRDPEALARLMKKVITGELKSDLRPIQVPYRNESLLQTIQQLIVEGK